MSACKTFSHQQVHQLLDEVLRLTSPRAGHPG